MLGTHPISSGYTLFLTCIPIIFHDTAGPDFWKNLRRSPKFRNRFCNLVRARHFQFATHAWLYVNRVSNAVCCKTAASPSLVFTLQVTKADVFNNLLYVGCFHKRGWIHFKMATKKYHLWQTCQRKESENCVSTGDNSWEKTFSQSIDSKIKVMEDSTIFHLWC
jgi:hypothetical protein